MADASEVTTLFSGSFIVNAVQLTPLFNVFYLPFPRYDLIMPCNIMANVGDLTVLLSSIHLLTAQMFIRSFLSYNQ